MRSPRLVLYARPDCHLCDQARAQLEALRAEGLPFELEEVDIDSDDRLLARYLERIPVVTLDGEVVSELGLDPKGLRARLDTVSG
ncbi:MAG: glutaredoxin family protein [Solirubrobacterales bacterium]